MFDRILELGTTFDWVTPLIAFVQDIVAGPSFTFLVPADCGWSGREIGRLLKRHGVRVWGMMIVSNTLMFSARKAQAQWAQYFLQREGIPIEYGLSEPPPIQPTSPGPKSDHLSLWAVIDRFLDELGLGEEIHTS